MSYTFRGGVHVSEHKNTARKSIEKLPLPALVALPLSQHIGAPAAPVVKVGDTVARGQVIGELQEGLGCPVHSSISGRVSAIEERTNASGARILNIIIENDFENRVDDAIKPSGREISEFESKEIIEAVRKAGISGMGGATFPTYAKIRSALGKADRIIINCAECEPYITANHRLMLENGEDIINGALVLVRALNLDSADIAIEDNKPDAIKLFKKLAAANGRINIRVMKTKYPQGDERQLIFALTGKELAAGKLPADVGCVIFNAETAAAVYHAVINNMPLIERVVTIDGDCISEPKNILAPLGASFKTLIDFAGGLVRQPSRVISGGPMMGIAQWDINAPVTKGTSAILVFSDPDYDTGKYACIRCGRCNYACPMHLMPNYLQMFAAAENLEMAEKFGAGSCVECGSCSYVCPGQVPLVQYIRLAKAKVIAKQRAEAAKNT